MVHAASALRSGRAHRAPAAAPACALRQRAAPRTRRTPPPARRQGLALAAAPRRAAADADCNPSLTFFPGGAEDFNVPTAWGRTQQRKAGNPYTDQLFTVVLSSKDNLPGSFAVGVPTLQARALRGGQELGAPAARAAGAVRTQLVALQRRADWRDCPAAGGT